MKEIKVRFNEADLHLLDQCATVAGISRAELIRSRAVVANCQHALTPSGYHRLVSDAAAQLHGAIPRRMVEHLVAYVLTWIASQFPQSNHPSSTGSMTP